MDSGNGITAIQYMGKIMKQDKLNIDHVFSMVEIINNSYLSSKDIVTILEDIFKNEKSAKILTATQILQFLIKNCNRNFHQASNRQSFQKSILGLLKRQRGKTSIIKDLTSNTENWSKIESKVLYLIQLWYDAFILEESKYPHIINTYKILRKENVIFPPRNKNERSLMAIQTESPIFDNIESIAESDKQKFKKRLKAMGMNELSQKIDKNDEIFKKSTPVARSREVNIDDISEKIAIIRSQQYEMGYAFKIIEEVKAAIQFGRVKPNEQAYWKDIKEAAEMLIQEWEQKNADLIKQQEQKYQDQKMNKPAGKKQEQKKESIEEPAISQAKPAYNNDFDLLGDEPVQNQTREVVANSNEKGVEQFNLLDL